jgi:hypothetical protein
MASRPGRWDSWLARVLCAPQAVMARFSCAICSRLGRALDSAVAGLLGALQAQQFDRG